MLRIVPEETKTKDLHQFLVGSIAPRPIAFVSTVDEEGNPNLAPYSFFNAFSSNPPILVFSSNRRVLNNTTKDTLSNVMNTKEVVINVVNHDIVRQMAVTSVEFPSNINEFEKAGLNTIPSEKVRPFRVKESPVQMECKVKEIITLGDHGGAGHLILCEVVLMHIAEHVVDENNRINPHKLDLMGRLGRAYYVRASGDAIQTIVQSVTEITIGFDKLPTKIQTSTVLRGNELGMLAGIKNIPSQEAIETAKSDPSVKKIIEGANHTEALHTYIADLLKDPKNNLEKAAAIAWI
jgi:flavin reductase (DIM6/NTAB) family NADH-FMN oxidoreductase RutF